MSGIDAATRALYESIVQSPRHAPTIEAIDRAAVPAPGSAAWCGLSVVLVPGILYRDYPETGADGAVLREVALELGLPFEVVDSDGTSGLAAGAQLVLDHLSRRGPGRCLLFSLSKGSAEILEALRADAAARAFAEVEAWVSISGIPLGTPVFEYTVESWLGGAYVQAACFVKRWSFEALRDLLRVRAYVPAPLPHAMTVLHVAAFPQRAHLRDRRSRRFHRRLGASGPNDGFVQLERLLELPGSIYPLWGVDHYLRSDSDLDLRALLRRCLGFLAGSRRIDR